MSEQLKNIILTEKELDLFWYQDGRIRIYREMTNPPTKLHDAWYWFHPNYDNGDGVDYIYTMNVTSFVSDSICAFCPYGKLNEELIIRFGTWLKEAHFMPSKAIRAKIVDLYIAQTKHCDDKWNWVITLEGAKVEDT